MKCKSMSLIMKRQLLYDMYDLIEIVNVNRCWSLSLFRSLSESYTSTNNKVFVLCFITLCNKTIIINKEFIFF
jgi:hypothetical protein